MTRRTKYDLEKAKEKAHILEGLTIALADIDEVIKTIKGSSDRQDAVAKLTQQFNLDEIQANAILDMRLQRLTGLEVSKIKADLEELHKQIADYLDILANEVRIWAIIKQELEQISNVYGEPRKTEISLDYGNIDIADLIPREDVVINLTHCGYVKRLPVAEYRAQHRAGLGVVGITTKDEDFVEKIFVTSSHDNLLFFTNYGKVYAIKGYEIPEASRQAKGRAIINLLQLQSGEKVTSLIPVNSTETGYLMMSTKNGLIKKTALSEFASIRKVGKIAIKLLEGDELISAELTNGDDTMIVSTHNGKCIHFSEKDVRAMGRDTQGVKCMDLAENDYLVSMIKVEEKQEFDENQPKIEENEQKNSKNGPILLTITENGFGKRSSIDDYRLQSRAGKGVKAGELNDKTGLLVGIKQVTDNDDIILISDKGTIIRVNSNEISKFGRDSMGVKVMKMADGEKVVSMAITPHNEDKVVDEQETERTAEGLNAENGATPEQIIEDVIQAENDDKNE